jgi:glycosyltransferase involved in cell wall biosynthesis
MILSILIATTYNRKNSFDILVNEIQRQIILHSLEKKIEVISICDGKNVSVGYKRQKLLEAASGDFICYIDSDDMIAETYCIDIVTAIENNINVDCVGFLINCDMEGKKENAISSNRYDDWCENKDGFKYCRTIYHKNPVRRSIALQVGFEDKRFGEDYTYSVGLKKRGLINSESFINKVLYYYQYKYENKNTKYGYE